MSGKNNNKPGNPHQGHRKRLRKRFLNFGLESFEDHEIIEMLLFNVIPRRNTNPTAHDLVNKFGDFKSVLDADIESLKEVKNIGESSAVFLKIADQLTKKYIHGLSVKREYKKISDIIQYFVDLFIGSETERIAVTCINSYFEVSASKFFEKTKASPISDNFGNIVLFSLQSGAGSVAIAHNHLNGSAFPTKNDIISTMKIYNTLKSVGVELIDHVIVAGNTGVSMRRTNAWHFD